jgi:hypothetical protein
MSNQIKPQKYFDAPYLLDVCGDPYFAIAAAVLTVAVADLQRPKYANDAREFLSSDLCMVMTGGLDLPHHLFANFT